MNIFSELEIILVQSIISISSVSTRPRWSFSYGTHSHIYSSSSCSLYGCGISGGHLATGACPGNMRYRLLILRSWRCMVFRCSSAVLACRTSTGQLVLWPWCTKLGLHPSAHLFHTLLFNTCILCFIFPCNIWKVENPRNFMVGGMYTVAYHSNENHYS